MFLESECVGCVGMLQERICKVLAIIMAYVECRRDGRKVNSLLFHTFCAVCENGEKIKKLLLM